MSVKDYLLSQHHVGAGFSLNEKLSHSHIAKTCLAYLLQFENFDVLNLDAIDRYPLAQYAAEYWVRHVHSGVEEGTDVQQEKLIMTLFQPWHTMSFVSWVKINDIDHDPYGIPVHISDIPSTFYYASSAGLLCAVQALVKNGVDVNMMEGKYGYALVVASYRGHEAIVGLLLEKGADVNAQGWKFGSALDVATFHGHEAIVGLLLEKGADVNAQRGKSGNALYVASLEGHEAIVCLLLEKGADVNAQGGRYGNALQAASLWGHKGIVGLLLEKGADVNAQGGEYGNALQAASLWGHEDIVCLLLEKGADVNAQGGRYGNALRVASLRGHEGTMGLLLEKGAYVISPPIYVPDPAFTRPDSPLENLVLELCQGDMNRVRQFRRG
jgi:ankyrin repeat protein